MPQLPEHTTQIVTENLRSATDQRPELDNSPEAILERVRRKSAWCVRNLDRLAKGGKLKDKVKLQATLELLKRCDLLEAKLLRDAQRLSSVARLPTQQAPNPHASQGLPEGSAMARLWVDPRRVEEHLRELRATKPIAQEKNTVANEGSERDRG